MSESGPALAEMGLSPKDLASANSPNLTRKQQIREFTRSTPEGQLARSQVAIKIRRERRAQQEVKAKTGEVSEHQGKLGESINQRQLQAEQAEQQTADLENQIRAREISLVKQVEDKIRGLFGTSPKANLERQRQASTGQQTQLEEGLEQSYQDYGQLSEELIRIVRQKQQLKDARQTLDKFYEDQGINLSVKERKDALEEYKETGGSVENVARRYNAYFIHGTQPNIEGGQNNPGLRDFVTWQDKVAVCVVEPVSLPTSTITRGLPKSSLWSAIGIVITGGKIEEACLGDSGSVTRGTKREVAVNRSYDIESYNANISSAIHTSRPYNEFTVGGDKQIAGLFINLDSRQIVGETYHAGTSWRRPNKPIQVKFQDVFDAANEFGMSVFAFKGGVAHEATIDSKTGQIVLGKEVSPTEMLERKYEVPEDKKVKIANQAKNSLSWQALT